MRNKNVAKRLFILWCALYFVAGFCCGLYIEIYKHKKGISPTDTIGVYHIAVIMLVLVLFYPLLWIMRHYAKLENTKWVRIAANILLIFLSIWLIAAGVGIIAAL